jgi:hypothetical protein
MGQNTLDQDSVAIPVVDCDVGPAAGDTLEPGDFEPVNVDKMVRTKWRIDVQCDLGTAGDEQSTTFRDVPARTCERVHVNMV